MMDFEYLIDWIVFFGSFLCFGFCNLLLFSWKLFYAFNLSALAILFFCFSFAPSLGFLFGRSCFCNCFLYFLKIFTSEVIFFWKLLLCNCFLMENFTSVNIFFQKTFTFCRDFLFWKLCSCNWFALELFAFSDFQMLLLFTFAFDWSLKDLPVHWYHLFVPI